MVPNKYQTNTTTMLVWGLQTLRIITRDVTHHYACCDPWCCHKLCPVWHRSQAINGQYLAITLMGLRKRAGLDGYNIDRKIMIELHCHLASKGLLQPCTLSLWDSTINPTLLHPVHILQTFCSLRLQPSPTASWYLAIPKAA